MNKTNLSGATCAYDICFKFTKIITQRRLTSHLAKTVHFLGNFIFRENICFDEMIGFKRK